MPDVARLWNVAFFSRKFIAEIMFHDISSAKNIKLSKYFNTLTSYERGNYSIVQLVRKTKILIAFLAVDYWNIIYRCNKN